MTEREALKLALEALEDLGMKHFESTGEVLYKETFKAIKEALAQPEQEPVQWGVDWGKAGDQSCVSIIKRKPDGGIEVLSVEYGPQRTWVGLTDDEIDQGLLRSDYAFKTAEAWRAGVVFAMTKLKEKNT